MKENFFLFKNKFPVKLKTKYPIIPDFLNFLVMQRAAITFPMHILRLGYTARDYYTLMNTFSCTPGKSN